MASFSSSRLKMGVNMSRSFSSSRLKMGVNMSRSITSTILKTKKAIETNKAIELSLPSSAVESLPKSEKDLIDPSKTLIRSDPSYKKDFSPSFKEIQKMLVEMRKEMKLKKASGAIFAGAVVTKKRLEIEETLEKGVFGKREYQEAALYNWPSSPWTKGETSSDIINCNRDSVEGLLDTVKWGEKGVVPAIFQDVVTGKVLKQTFANREDLATAISSGKATFYDPSQSLLTKGELSPNFKIHDIFLNCNRDSILCVGKPDGPTCHTCSETSYHNSVLDYLNNHRAAQNRPPLATLYPFGAVITPLQQAKVETIVNGMPARMNQRLLNQKLPSKIRKEVSELCQILEDNEERSRTGKEEVNKLCQTLKDIEETQMASEMKLKYVRK